MDANSIQMLSHSLGTGFVRASFVSAALVREIISNFEAANSLGLGNCAPSQVIFRKSVKSLVILILVNC